MAQFIAAAQAALSVLLVSLCLGAGLPLLFSLGVQQLAAAHVPGSAGARWHGTVHKVISFAIFALVVVAVLFGLSYIVIQGFGLKYVFDGLIPHIVHK